MWRGGQFGRDRWRAAGEGVTSGGAYVALHPGVHVRHGVLRVQSAPDETRHRAVVVQVEIEGEP